MRSARLESPKVLNLDRFTVNWPSPVSTFFQPLAERALALSEFNNLFGRVERLPYRDFCSGLLDELQVWPDLDNRDVEKVPKEGPLVVVANHPFGGVDGIILTSLLLEIRPDFKLMVNHVVRGMPQIRELTFAVDPFESHAS